MEQNKKDPALQKIVRAAGAAYALNAGPMSGDHELTQKFIDPESGFKGVVLNPKTGGEIIYAIAATKFIEDGAPSMKDIHSFLNDGAEHANSGPAKLMIEDAVKKNHRRSQRPIHRP